ncbi:MAG: hypothetical protein D6805_10445 [Planctomycetota bacterium]|nr:MAG: hypothetical protein D6805_10445 [Planctomycetota bacterium]
MYLICVDCRRLGRRSLRSIVIFEEGREKVFRAPPWVGVEIRMQTTTFSINVLLCLWVRGGFLLPRSSHTDPPPGEEVGEEKTWYMLGF